MIEQRLIDANAFKECWKPGVIGDTLRLVIDDQPTIAPETLPIGRCVECIRYSSEAPGVGVCINGFTKKDDDFCNYFEQKECEQNG